MLRRPLTRRQFLKRSVGVVGVAAFSQLGAHCADDIDSEGIYTNRFTYRPGDDILSSPR